MSRRLFFNSLPRGIFDVTREIQMLTSLHQPPALEIRTLSPLHLPEVREPAQYLIDMGLRPALARRVSSTYMYSVARYRQTFESYFRLAIQERSHFHPKYYRDIFVIQFKGTIQVLESQFMSIARVWLSRASLHPTPFWPQRIDVKIPIFTTFFTKLTDLCGLGTRGRFNESSSSFETGPRNNIVYYGCGWFKFYLCFWTSP